MNGNVNGWEIYGRLLTINLPKSSVSAVTRVVVNLPDHFDEWLVNGLLTLQAEPRGFRNAVVARALTKLVGSAAPPHDEVKRPNESKEVWPGFLDLLQTSTEADLIAWQGAPVLWHRSSIWVETLATATCEDHLEVDGVLDFFDAAVKGRLRWCGTGTRHRLYEFRRPTVLPTWDQNRRGSNTALLLSMSSEVGEAFPTEVEKPRADSYFFVVGEFTRPHFGSPELITPRSIEALYSSLAGGAAPRETKCWEGQGSQPLGIAVGVEGALVIWPGPSPRASSAQVTQVSEGLVPFGPAAALGLLWLISIYQRESSELCAKYSVQLSNTLRSGTPSIRLMEDAKRLVHWTVQEELCWMYSEASEHTQFNEAFQMFQSALDIERLWQDIREQCTVLDHYLQTEHSARQSRSLSRLTMLAVPVPLVTALLTLNASDAQYWGNYIRADHSTPWLQPAAISSVAAPADPPTSAASTLMTMVCDVEPKRDGAAPPSALPASSAKLSSTLHCAFNGANDGTAVKSTGVPLAPVAAKTSPPPKTENPLSSVLGAVLAFSLALLGFALNALWARVLFTIAAVAVAWFFMPALLGASWWALLGSGLLIASALTYWREPIRNRLDQISEAFSKSAAHIFAERLFDLLPLIVAVGCVAVLLRSLWLISQ